MTDHNAPTHDWESCAECVEQAKNDGILGPDAEPHRTPEPGEYGYEEPHEEMLLQTLRKGV